MPHLRHAIALFALLALAGCGSGKSGAPAPGKSETKSAEGKTEAGHVHEHHAPHQGALVELGEEFAHVEIVFDAASGKITAYVLDGEAEKPVRVKQAELELSVSVAGKDGAAAEKRAVKLKAVASTLTGETVGDTSQFEGEDANLKGLKSFDAELVAIEARGQVFKNVAFNYPKGNEEAEHKH